VSPTTLPRLVPLLGLLAHPVLQVVVDDELQLLAREAIVLGKNAVDLVDERFRRRTAVEWLFLVRRPAQAGQLPKRLFGKSA
jgi:hypothetical protein